MDQDKAVIEAVHRDPFYKIITLTFQGRRWIVFTSAEGAKDLPEWARGLFRCWSQEQNGSQPSASPEDVRTSIINRLEAVKDRSSSYANLSFFPDGWEHWGPAPQTLSPLMSYFADGLEQFHPLFQSAKQEVRDWASTSPEAVLYGSNWFDRLVKLIGRAEDSLNMGQLEARMEIIARIVVESGPLSENFAPSLEQIFKSLEKRKEKEHKKRR